MEPNKPKQTPDTDRESVTKKPDTGVKKDEREIEENESESGYREDEKRDNEGYVDFSKLF